VLHTVSPVLENWQEQLRRGSLEMAVLLAVAPGPRYGLEIIRHLEEFTDLVLTEGHDLSDYRAPCAGRRAVGRVGSGRSAAPRKYYRLTPAGRHRLTHMCREFSVRDAPARAPVARVGQTAHRRGAPRA